MYRNLDRYRYSNPVRVRNGAPLLSPGRGPGLLLGLGAIVSFSCGAALAQPGRGCGQQRTMPPLNTGSYRE